MDDEFVVAVKQAYDHCQVSKALDSIENCAKIYEIDELTAMSWVAEVWTEMDLSMICHCWFKIVILTNYVLNISEVNIQILFLSSFTIIYDRFLPVQHQKDIVAFIHTDKGKLEQLVNRVVHLQ